MFLLFAFTSLQVIPTLVTAALYFIAGAALGGLVGLILGFIVRLFVKTPALVIYFAGAGALLGGIIGIVWSLVST